MCPSISTRTSVRLSISALAPLLGRSGEEASLIDSGDCRAPALRVFVIFSSFASCPSPAGFTLDAPCVAFLCKHLTWALALC